MQVEIFSDVVCPWCYIGKRRFEAALERFAGRDEVEVTWRAYQLDPTAPRRPEPVLDVYARKFGGPARAVEIVGHLTDVARDAGIDLRLEDAWRANTFDAHRLLWLAGVEGAPGVQDRLQERLFRAYFAEGADVADPSVLARLATEAGLERTRVEALLASDEGCEPVRAELDRGLDLGVAAVPTFVFEGQWAVPGAQDADVFLQVLERVRARLEPARPGAEATAAGACEDDVCGV
ncbi:MAG: DsbA family oxidoreductase [Acidimicrobiales bacterium]|nr:DsbA family oxidoreductase [Acidimicrobiales bacterium]